MPAHTPIAALASLAPLFRRAELWHGKTPATDPDPKAGTETLPTGYPQLDTHLPGGGWPQTGLTEIISDNPAMPATLGLLLPALAKLSRTPRWLTWIAPPHIPYAPALTAQGIDLSRILLVRPSASRDGLWAVEQALRSGTCSIVMAWLAGTDQTGLRRLQLAARAGHCWCVLFRSGHSASQPSPATLRLRLDVTDKGPVVQIIKCRGSWTSERIPL